MDLVDQLPESPSPELRPEPGLPLVEVYTAYGGTRAALIKSLLEGSGIDCVLSGNLNGAGYRLHVGDLGKVRVLVKAEDEASARELINAAARGALDIED